MNGNHGLKAFYLFFYFFCYLFNYCCSLWHMEYCTNRLNFDWTSIIWFIFSFFLFIYYFYFFFLTISIHYFYPLVESRSLDNDIIFFSPSSPVFWLNEWGKRIATHATLLAIDLFIKSMSFIGGGFTKFINEILPISLLCFINIFFQLFIYLIFLKLLFSKSSFQIYLVIVSVSFFYFHNIYKNKKSIAMTSPQMNFLRIFEF